MTVRISAPGKLFLLGEYAVLDGAPALLTAIDRRVTVTVTPSIDDAWRVSALGLGIDALRLGERGELPAELSSSTRASLAVFDAVRNHLLSPRGPAAPAPLTVVIDSTEFQHDGHKLGLGSSAAVAVALTAALDIAMGNPLSPDADGDSARLREVATAAHSAAQGGTGSGADVATSVYGGLLLYTQGTEPMRMAWPEGLAGFAIATGTGSGTVALVERVREYARSDPSGYRAALDDLGHLARLAQTSLDAAPQFLQLADDYFVALQTLDRAAKAGIVTEQHLRLRERARRAGGVFKTSGAGGGDLGLVFGQTSRLDDLNHEFASSYRIPLSWNSAGWRREAA